LKLSDRLTSADDNDGFSAVKTGIGWKNPNKGELSVCGYQDLLPSSPEIICAPRRECQITASQFPAIVSFPGIYIILLGCFHSIELNKDYAWSIPLRTNCYVYEDARKTPGILKIARNQS
jgi:hypothetical protein